MFSSLGACKREPHIQMYSHIQAVLNNVSLLSLSSTHPFSTKLEVSVAGKCSVEVQFDLLL